MLRIIPLKPSTGMQVSLEMTSSQNTGLDGITLEAPIMMAHLYRNSRVYCRKRIPENHGA